jgi:hypothetical protein
MGSTLWTHSLAAWFQCFSVSKTKKHLGVTRSQTLEAKVEGCDHQRRPALARFDVGQSVGNKAASTTGSAYQGKSE